jgi:hypothetical protein
MFSFPRCGFSTGRRYAGAGAEHRQRDGCELTVTNPVPRTSAIRLTRPVTLRYVEIGPHGPVATGSGLRRITENE